MKAVVLTVVFYVFIVFFGIVLLAAVQLRSAGGANIRYLGSTTKPTVFVTATSSTE